MGIYYQTLACFPGPVSEPLTFYSINNPDFFKGRTGELVPAKNGRASRAFSSFHVRGDEYDQHGNNKGGRAG